MDILDRQTHATKNILNRQANDQQLNSTDDKDDSQTFSIDRRSRQAHVLGRKTYLMTGELD
jgi:hypothetical protein